MAQTLVRTLNARVVGSGEHTVVLLQGFGTDQYSWSRVLPHLIQDHRVVLFDLACTGTVNPDTFHFGRYATLDAYADDLLHILDAYRINNCTYVGHSVAATIGMLASIKRPGIFNKLIAIGFTPSVVNEENYHGGFERADLEAVISALEWNNALWGRGRAAELLLAVDMPEAVQEFSRALFRMRPDISLHVSKTMFSADIRSLLGSVTVPCCLIHTAMDMAVPAPVPTYVRNHLGGQSTLRILNAEGHLPQISAPDLLAHELREELQSQR